MDKELFRNGSGYADPTAYKALTNYQKGESNMEFKRGEIFQYKIGYDYKPALVVSADYRASDNILNIIVLSEEEKRDSVEIVCRGVMYADCSFISYGYASAFGSFIRMATEAEMEAIDAGIAKSLGIKRKTLEIERTIEKTVEVPVETSSAELASARTEASIYKNLYEQLLEKMMDRGY